MFNKHLTVLVYRYDLKISKHMLKKGGCYKCLAYGMIEAYVVLKMNLASLVTKDAISSPVIENILPTYLRQTLLRNQLKEM